MSKQIILFIVEGEKRDYRFVEEMTQCFFRGKYQVKIISLAASQNIYMLYQKIRPDAYYLISNNTIRSFDKITEKELRKAHNIQKMYKAGAFNE